jgi:FkbM family methyltransferase
MRRTIQEVNTRVGRFHCFRDDTVTEHLVRFGAHTRNELAMVLSFLRAGDTVVDAGAHIGTFSVPMAAKVGASGKVVSFEGCAETFELLERNVELNGLHRTIQSHWAVVTDRPARYAPVAKRFNSGGTFFRHCADAHNFPPCVVLDQWFSKRGGRVDLIKIDVEGMEHKVLRGSCRLLRRFKPVLYVEINTPALERQSGSVDALEADLGDLGYHFFRNASLRNSATDAYKVARLPRLRDGGRFFDLLAVHSQSPIYPRRAEPFDLAAYMALAPPKPHLPARVLRRVRRLVARHLSLKLR